MSTATHVSTRRGSASGRPGRRRSASAIMAGKARRAATAQSKIPPPATIPSSDTPVNSVKPAVKKAIAVVTAPVMIALAGTSAVGQRDHGG